MLTTTTTMTATSSIAALCLRRELCGSGATKWQQPQQQQQQFSAAAQSLALSRVPGSLAAHKEHLRFPCEASFDKVFAARWLDDDTVCFGTKCNRLVLWSPATRGVRVVALPKLSSSRRPSVQHAPSSSSSVSSPPSSPPSSAAATAATTTAQQHVFGTPRVVERPVTPPNVAFTSDPALACGIHDIDLDSTRAALICGADNPADVVLFRLPTFEAAALLHGHQDWVFASRFLSDTVAVTGARDGMISLWRLPSPQGDDGDGDGDGEMGKYDPRIPLGHTMETVEAHEQKVRCIERSPWADEFLTLSSDASVKFWDSSRVVSTKKIELDDSRDLVSLATSAEHGLVAVGAQGGTSVFDWRTGECVAQIDAVGGQWGVRSLTFNRDVLTIGGGGGAISFYDLRAHIMRTSAGSSSNSSSSSSSRPFLQCSTGYLRNTDMFFGEELPQAAYTIQYDSLNTRIFVGGGPLMCGLSGCYGSVWG